LLGLDDWPWYDGKIVAMKARDEVSRLFHLDDLLEFELKSAIRVISNTG
jgi:hypothetical protein